MLQLRMLALSDVLLLADLSFIKMSRLTYAYGFWGRHVGLIYATVVALGFIPLPFYGTIIFGANPPPNAYMFSGIVGLVAAIVYLWGDFRNQRRFFAVALDDLGIEFSSPAESEQWKWREITRAEKIKPSDRDYLLSFGIGGIRLVNSVGKTICIFNTIQGFASLVETVERKTGIPLSK